MNNNIKNISITRYLKSIGYQPARSAYGCSWFSSPLKSGDKEPSFKVDEGKNVWYDHSQGFGGTLFTLIKELFHISDSEVFKILEGLDPTFYQKPSYKTRQQKLIIDDVIALRSPSLIDYLNVRAINIRYARLHISQVYYTNRENQYYALGFRNDKGGWELRSKDWKGSSSPKYITTIPGKVKGLNVFEGFMDYLSALSYFGCRELKYTTIVLNSVSFVKDLIPVLAQYPLVNLFLDNDEAGTKAVTQISRNHSNIRNLAIELYPDYKDFNEMLIESKSKK